MLSFYLGIWSYCFMNSDNLSYLWMILLACMNMGFGALVFHETSHYTGFKNQKLNNIISYFLMSPIITTQEWKYEHNYLHHCFTNTEYDCDFENNKYLIRHSSNHKHFFHHRFQFIYSYLLFFLGGFTKGPLNSITYKRWNILLVIIIPL